MQRFAALYRRLDTLTATSAKVAALADYLTAAPAADAAWAIALLGGQRPRRLLRAGELRTALVSASGLPEWLVEHSHHHVGDLAETVALLTGNECDGSRAPPLPTLARFVEDELLTLPALDEAGRQARLLDWWRRADRDTRFLIGKLLTGGFRVGVSQRLVTQALAQASGLPVELLAERLAGRWQPGERAMAALLRPAHAGDGPGERPYPFFLASPLSDTPSSLPGAREDWLAEWKWDGIRVQVIRRGDTVALWSRGEERLDGRFPEIEAAALALPPGTVLDGELLAWRDDAPLPFNVLQKRIGRLRPSARSQAEQPVAVLAYDLLEWRGEDLREAPLRHRRQTLADCLATLAAPRLRLSPALPAADWQALARHREDARSRGVEGLMLKRLDSPYRAGRRRGDWWKWKIDPYTLDCVLVYAQAGHGRRATLYTDYTFAVWDGDALVPVAKAYSGLSDAEILSLDRWIRAHTRERFGPVRAVEPVQVFELAFEGIASSNRHKSGVAVRFPRILRWRTDKTAADADTLATLRALAMPSAPP